MGSAEQRLREFLKQIAKDLDYDNYDLQVEPVTSDGANYTSQLLAATLSATGKPDLKLFAKVAAMGEQIRSMSSTTAFDIETLIYNKIIPKYKKLEEKFKIPENQRLSFCNYYGSSTENMNEMLIMEDLRHQGYRVFDRLKCYDWNYASECVSLLAKMHALSVAYERDDPEDYANSIKILKFDFPIDIMKGFLEKCISTAVKCTDDKYKDRVEKILKEHFIEKKFLKYNKPKRSFLLQHGDFRPSNMLHKTDGNGKLQLVLVDYQLVQRGNPVTDLLFFLIAGSDEEFRANHMQQYFDHYYVEFTKALKRFGINPDEVYKKEEYHEDLKELLPFGVTLGAFALPIITVDASKASKPEDGVDIKDLEMEVSELFPIRFNGIVRDFVRLGLL